MLIIKLLQDRLSHSRDVLSALMLSEVAGSEVGESEASGADY